MPTPTHFDRRRENALISTNPALVDLAAVHAFLTDIYWCRDVPLETVRRAIDNSLCFGVYIREGDETTGRWTQAGLTRVITDRATFAYLTDVFILAPYRSRGLSKWMMECILQHPDLQGLRRWMLLTRDAHSLYRKVGFTEPARPDRIMEMVFPDAYRKPGEPPRQDPYATG